MAFTDSFLSTPAVPSTITQNGMLDRVRGDVGLRGSNLLTDADIIAWSNEASDLIAQETRWYRKVGTMNAVAAQAEYNLPAQLISVEEVHFNEMPMYRLSLSDLQKNYAYWRRQGDGTPIFYYIHGNSAIGLTPTPSTSITAGIFVVYTALPPHPASGTDTYTVPYAGERAIISYAKLKAAEKDAVGEGRQRFEVYTRNWLADLDAVKRAVESVAEGECTTFGQDIEPALSSQGLYWPGFDQFQQVGPP